MGQIKNIKLHIVTDIKSSDICTALKMSTTTTTALLLVCLCVMEVCVSAAEVTKLQIGVKKKVKDCARRSRKGDDLKMHYTGKLHSTIPRGEPLAFTLGAGQVIKGWDQGLLNMCEGEKRKLVIPASLGYGDNGAPPKIPGGAALVFEVELVKISNKNDEL